MDQDEKLRRHLLDLAALAEKRYNPTNSGFLNLAEQDLFCRLQPEFAPVHSTLTGGFPQAERKIALFWPDDSALAGFAPEADVNPDSGLANAEAAAPISVLLIAPVNLRFAEDLTHRDYLGAILNLGIDRSLTGDILVKDHLAYVFCLENMKELLIRDLTRVRNTSVTVSEVSRDIPELVPEYQELRVNVASERLDAVVAALAGVSRSKAVDLFPAQRVFVNSRIVTDPGKKLKEGDVLSVRGFGKAIYQGINGESRKGRLYITLKVPI